MLANIELHKLHKDPRSANVCTPETVEKLRRNIERTGLCPHLIVRPHPTEADQFIIIDGYHRLLILTALHWSSVDCQVWEVDEAQAGLLLATLNRLRGTDDFHLRAELLQALNETIPLEELTLLIPESKEAFQDMMAMLQLDMEAQEEAFKQQIEAEAAQMPVPLSFMVSAEGAKIIEAALAPYLSPAQDRGEALVNLCQDSYALKAPDIPSPVALN